MKQKKSLLRFFRNNRKLVELARIFFIIIALILVSALVITIFEPSDLDPKVNIKSFFDAIWWTIVTITTVGYGDFFPVTVVGRIIGIFIIISGFIIFSTFTAYIASNFIDKKIKERKGLNKIKLRNHIVICGWNNSGRRILKFWLNIATKILLQ